MATVEYLHVCDYAFADHSGKPCIIGIFDRIFAQHFPAQHPMMALAMRFRGNAHEVLRLKIELGRPNGDVVATLQGDITLGPDGSGFMQMNLAGTIFPEPGRYTVKVLSGGESLHTHSLHLQKAQPPPTGPQSTPERRH
jgi:hypothetical protein